MIFENASRTRRNLFWLGTVCLALAGLGVAGAILALVFINPTWKPTSWRAEIKPGHVEFVSATAHDKKANQDLAAPTGEVTAASPGRQALAAQNLSSKPFLRTAFMVLEDPASIADYRARTADVDVVFPTCFSVSTADGKLRRSAPANVDSAFFAPTHVVMPVISNTDAESNWHPDELALLLDDRAAGDRLIQQLLSQVKLMQADGINIDFEQLNAVERDNLSFWIKHLGEAFHAEHLLVTVDVPLHDEAFDYEYIGEVADFVVAMAYDEHYPGGKPGSVAGQHWFESGIDEIAERVPANKMLVALGAYGYDWNTVSKAPAQSLSFTAAMLLAASKHSVVSAGGVEINSHFSYTDEAKALHQVWLLDAVSAWNQVSYTRKKKLRGYSLWRMGLEDHGIWHFLGQSDPAKMSPESLKTIWTEPVVKHVGVGEVLRVSSLTRDGQRELTFNGERVTEARSQSLPSYSTVEKFGHAHTKRIALTFDDGPDPVWTPEVLGVLRQHDVHATFFVIGDEVEKYPPIVRQVIAAGHVLGNHTFYHPNISQISESRLRTELNFTQRAIESATGRGTILFRAPFDIDSTPSKPEQLAPLYQVAQLGYLVVGGDIDASDYTKPGADVIVNNVMAELKEDGPNIVVMHDGGGDRRQTVEALKKLIPMLKLRGYEFVTINQLLVASTAEMMPVMSSTENVVMMGNGVVTWLRTTGWNVLRIIFMSATAVSILRILFVGILVIRHCRDKRPADRSFTPPVTVVIPAYNEAKVIERTLNGVLRSDYPALKIIVVDDGSRDKTCEIVRRYTVTHPQVELLAKTNGGKWSALNAGFLAADTEYIVTIDADTIVTTTTVSELIAPFADPKVDAVCGNVQVGNVHNILTAFQDVEYVTMQNYDRRAFDHLNCISVVPGATGGWRRDAVLAVGGSSNQSLTEDADLTLTMLANGARIVNAAEARSITEAPETLSALFKQRVRWSYGTFQCLWKHRRHFFRGSLGWVALPNLLIFQLIYPLLSPLGDIVLIASLVRGEVSVVASWYLVFIFLDMVGSLVAFYLERKPIWRLWVVFIQRFYYRQFLYVVALKSVFQALKGSRQFWNKLERRGTVIAQGEAYMAPMATSSAINSFAGARTSALMAADAVES